RFPPELLARSNLVRGSFTQLAEVMAEHGHAGADLFLFDLGMSSMQLDTARGFAFRLQGPLDMRMAGDAARVPVFPTQDPVPEPEPVLDPITEASLPWRPKPPSPPRFPFDLAEIHARALAERPSSH